MGCSPSLPFSEICPRPLFHVWNVDDEGQLVKSCHIQVTNTDLVLHQRGESAVLWPLQCLRRYGFDSDLFSFECGRRCATGPGIYAFKCKRAESLFNSLQEALQTFSESELGLSSTNGPEVTESLTNDDVEEIVDDGFDYGVDSQPSTSTGIKKIPKPEITVPSVPEESQSSSSTQSIIPRVSSSMRRHAAKESLPCLPKCFADPYPRMQDYGSQHLPRCCVIGTCINAAKHYTNEKALRSTTCGSCRTCSLNMCVVRPAYASSIGATDSEERARQADYGNVLNSIGVPRQCVHCCCDFKPSKKMSSCSADDCPLHFNNCVDQVTNYARLDKHLRKEYSTTLKLKKMKSQQPVNFSSYAHLYNRIPTPTKKWPFSEKHTKSPSWRSLPQFRTISSVIKLMPKRSASHFYSNAGSSISVKATKTSSEIWLKKKKNDIQKRMSSSCPNGTEETSSAGEVMTTPPEDIPSENSSMKNEAAVGGGGEEEEDNGSGCCQAESADIEKKILSDSVGSIILVDSDEFVNKTIQCDSLSSISS